jgi:hypothetical protein
MPQQSALLHSPHAAKIKTVAGFRVHNRQGGTYDRFVLG